MKITDALKTTEPTEPSLEDRVKALEVNASVQRATLLSAIGTLAYNDPYFAGQLVRHVDEAVKARSEDDAADIGG